MSKQEIKFLKSLEEQLQRGDLNDADIGVSAFLAENQDFENYKVCGSFSEFVDDPQYLGVGEDTWKVVKEEGDEIWKLILEGKITEAILLWGIGSGKSYLSAVLSLLFVHYLLCLKNPHKHYNLTNDKPIAVVNMGTTATQAKNVIFASLKKFVMDSPFFQSFNPEILATEIRFPDKNITLYCGNSQETMPIGMNVIFATLDEAAWYLDTENKSTAENIYNTMKNRIISRFGDRGIMLIISAIRYAEDFILRHYEKMEGKGYIYASMKKTWETKDRNKMKEETFDFIVSLETEEIWKGIPMDFKKAADSNPERFMRDFGVKPSLVLEAYDRDAQIVVRDANSSRQHPCDTDGQLLPQFKLIAGQDTAERYIHIDLGLKKDACGFAMGKFDGWQEIEGEKRAKIFIDLMLQIKVRPGDEIRFSGVRQLVYSLIERGYNIRKITFDGWQCNLGSNKVKLINGTNKRIDEITSEEWIYSYDLEKKEIIPALCKSAIKTGIKVPVYEVEIDNGEKIHFTQEHLILMKDGSYKMVQDLKQGDSLMPLYTKYYNRKTKTRSIQKYEQVMQPEIRKWEMTHDMVARNIYGNKPKNNVVHHRNFNSEDNSPINLQYSYIKSHIKLHKELSDIRWNISGEKEKQALLMRERNKKFNLPSLLKPPTKETAKKIKKVISNKWKNDKVYQEKMRKRFIYSGELSPHFNKEIKNELLFKICSESSTLKEVKCKLKLKNNLFVIRRLNSFGYKGFKDYKSQKNHKVVSVRFYGYEDVYDIEVPNYHNFGLEAGVFVHNSVDSIQILKERGLESETLSVDRDTKAYDTLKEALHNHRIDFYAYEPFQREYQRLEYVRGRKVDHPQGGSKDVSDAVAGVCFNIIETMGEKRPQTPVITIKKKGFYDIEKRTKGRKFRIR